MIKFFAKASLMVAFVTLLAGVTQAQKFGYVNSGAIISEMPEMKQIKSSLQAYKTQLEKQGDAKVTKFKEEEQAAIQKKSRGEMTPKEEEVVMTKLQTMQEEIYTMRAELETKLMERQQEEMKPVLEKVNEAIQAVATEGGYQYIFELQSGVLLYADESADVTNLVKEKLNIPTDG